MRGEEIYVKHPTDSCIRTGGFHNIYFNIAQDEYVKCLDVETIDTSSMHPGEKGEVSNLADKHKAKAIVFAALCVEAAINNYTGMHFGDKYSEKHLQSLDVISKWVVIPRLACGRSIDKSGPAFNSLTQLVRARNKLVHNKSVAFDPDDPIQVNRLFKLEADFDKDFRNSLKALYLLSMEMDFLVGQLHNPLKTLDKEFNVFLEIPEQVKPLFDECKEIILNMHPVKAVTKKSLG